MATVDDDDDAAFELTFTGPALAMPTAQAPKRITNGSEEQTALWEELIQGTDNIVVQALAGSGKSSSSREGMYRILEWNPRARIAYCCFNKEISTEFASQSPRGVEVGTMHSMGLKMIKRAVSNVTVDARKTFLILDKIAGDKVKGYTRRTVDKVVGLVKSRGISPHDEDRPTIELAIADIITEFGIETYRDTDLIVSLSYEVLKRSAEDIALINFDDMVWLPAILDIQAPTYDYLFIDEAQDLSPVQHMFAEIIGTHSRTVVVGDSNQAIYAWRGATPDSMEVLGDRLDARTMPLTITWRCPTSHVELAQEYVPQFRAAPGATEGMVTEALRGSALGDLQPGTLVLCRCNAPLLQTCLQAISARQPARMRGRGFGEELGVIIRSIRDVETCGKFQVEIENWRARNLEKFADRDGFEDQIERINDRADCLAAVATAASDVPEITRIVSDLFTDAKDGGHITFSSVHRAKGSEADRVVYIQTPFHEPPPGVKVPAWEAKQRHNLEYVALTRSKDSLTLTQ